MSTSIYYGARRSGRTSELIKLSAETGYPIVTLNREFCRSIELRAEQMGIDIPAPISFCNFKNFGIGRRIDHILIDDVDLVIGCYLGARVEAVSLESFDDYVLGLNDIDWRRAR